MSMLQPRAEDVKHVVIRLIQAVTSVLLASWRSQKQPVPGGRLPLRNKVCFGRTAPVFD